MGALDQNNSFIDIDTTDELEGAIFRHKRFDTAFLQEYGFEYTDGCYTLTKEFMEGEFTAVLTVSGNGTMHSSVIDNMNDEEYAQLRNPSFCGPYVSQVRSEYENLLKDIADKCCTDESYELTKSPGQTMDRQLIQMILDIADSVPEGKVVSYGQIAQMIGRPKNARLVGKVMSLADRYGDHPCHRVVNHAGRTVPGWVEQRSLLEAEGVRFKENGCVDMKKFRL